MEIDLIKRNFPSLNEPELVTEIETKASTKFMVAGETLIDIGQYIKNIPLLLSGKLKVFRQDADGNELFLYHIMPGETCAISLICSSSNQISKVKAVCIENAEIITIPLKYMDIWVHQYNSWYQFILSSYRKRFEDLLETIDSIAFQKLDERLLSYLKKHQEANNSDIIELTHQYIANELNTSREVISRLLKQMEKKGIIKLSRNQIEFYN